VGGYGRNVQFQGVAARQAEVVVRVVQGLGVGGEVVGVHGVETASAGEGVAKSPRAGAHIGDAVAGRVGGGRGHNIKGGWVGLWACAYVIVLKLTPSMTPIP
jgi:hypothetical protein